MIDDICRQCEMPDCNENSLNCVFRLLTNPNAAQQKLLGTKTVKPRKAKRSAVPRSEYYAEYYQRNRDRKLAAANARHAAKREGV